MSAKLALQPHAAENLAESMTYNMALRLNTATARANEYGHTMLPWQRQGSFYRASCATCGAEGTLGVIVSSGPALTALCPGRRMAQP